MSTEKISIGSATINGAFENETNSLPRSESQPRFRISKPPTYEDCIDAGILGENVTTPSTPSAQHQNGEMSRIITYDGNMMFCLISSFY